MRLNDISPAAGSKKIRLRGEPHPTDIRTGDGDIGLVPETDVRRIFGDGLLRLAVVGQSLFIGLRCRRQIDQPIDFFVAVVRSVETERRHLGRMKDPPQHVGIGYADPLQRVHLYIAAQHVSVERGELVRANVYVYAGQTQVLLNYGCLEPEELVG